jgi:hypothetical protein
MMGSDGGERLDNPRHAYAQFERGELILRDHLRVSSATETAIGALIRVSGRRRISAQK